MPFLTTTRTLFELRVGSTHTIEVLLQIRSSDIPWWNADLRAHERQLHKLIGRRVLPVECRVEIEADRARIRAKADFEKAKKGEVVIGESNLKKKATKEKGGGKKRGAGKKGKKDTKASKKQKASDKSGDGENASESTGKKQLKLCREPGKWVMGQSIQICYTMEDIEKNTASTLVFRTRQPTAMSDGATQSQSPGETQTRSSETTEGEEKLVPMATFRSWKKLGKRINLFVFRFNPNDPADLSLSDGGGFPRPELLPVADLFRSVGGDD
ncbi:hypothetical protein ACHAXT_000430 [Thalassiosira profunda]